MILFDKQPESLKSPEWYGKPNAMKTTPSSMAGGYDT